MHHALYIPFRNITTPQERHRLKVKSFFTTLLLITINGLVASPSAQQPETSGPAAGTLEYARATNQWPSQKVTLTMRAPGGSYQQQYYVFGVQGTSSYYLYPYVPAGTIPGATPASPTAVGIASASAFLSSPSAAPQFTLTQPTGLTTSPTTVLPTRGTITTATTIDSSSQNQLPQLRGTTITSLQAAQALPAAAQPVPGTIAYAKANNEWPSQQITLSITTPSDSSYLQTYYVFGLGSGIYLYPTQQTGTGVQALLGTTPILFSAPTTGAQFTLSTQSGLDLNYTGSLIFPRIYKPIAIDQAYEESLSALAGMSIHDTAIPGTLEYSTLTNQWPSQKVTLTMKVQGASYHQDYHVFGLAGGNGFYLYPYVQTSKTYTTDTQYEVENTAILLSSPSAVPQLTKASQTGLVLNPNPTLPTGGTTPIACTIDANYQSQLQQLNGATITGLGAPAQPIPGTIAYAIANNQWPSQKVGLTMQVQETFYYQNYYVFGLAGGGFYLYPCIMTLIDTSETQDKIQTTAILLSSPSAVPQLTKAPPTGLVLSPNPTLPTGGTTPIACTIDANYQSQLQQLNGATITGLGAPAQPIPGTIAYAIANNQWPSQKVTLKTQTPNEFDYQDYYVFGLAEGSGFYLYPEVTRPAILTGETQYAVEHTAILLSSPSAAPQFTRALQTGLVLNPNPTLPTGGATPIACTIDANYQSQLQQLNGATITGLGAPAGQVLVTIPYAIANNKWPSRKITLQISIPNSDEPGPYLQTYYVFGLLGNSGVYLYPIQQTGTGLQALLGTTPIINGTRGGVQFTLSAQGDLNSNFSGPLNFPPVPVYIAIASSDQQSLNALTGAQFVYYAEPDSLDYARMTNQWPSQIATLTITQNSKSVSLTYYVFGTPDNGYFLYGTLTTRFADTPVAQANLLITPSGAPTFVFRSPKTIILTPSKPFSASALVTLPIQPALDPNVDFLMQSQRLQGATIIAVS